LELEESGDLQAVSIDAQHTRLWSLRARQSIAMGQRSLTNTHETRESSP